MIRFWPDCRVCMGVRFVGRYVLRLKCVIPEEYVTMIKLASIISLLKQNIDDLQGIYLFGSHATGRSRPDSDVDLAVLATTAMDPVRRWDIASECGIVLQRDVDLIDLRNAKTLLQYQVITEGQRIYTANENICDAFENRIMSEYLDFQMFLQPLIDAIHKRGSIYG